MWLGIDIGTSAAKAVLVDRDGAVAARAAAPIHTDAAGGHAEQDAADYLTAARTAIHELGADPADIGGIGLSGHTPSLVLVDERGDPVRPVMTWQDTRAGPQATALAARFGDPLPWIGTSLPWAASACPAKLAWIAEHEPTVPGQTRWALQPKDYVGLALTGNPLSDPWSSKGLCHVGSGEPVTDVLAASGWTADVVPPLAAGWTSRGPLTERGGALIGLPGCRAEVTVGLSDALCGMLASGAFCEPTAFIITGTSAIVGVSAASVPAEAGGLYVVPTSCVPLGIVYGPTNTSGEAVAWACRLLGVTPDELLDLAVAADSSDRRGGRTVPVFVPYLTGERAPLWRDDVRAAFGGLGVDHDRGDLALAVLRGIALNERSLLAAAEALAGETSTVHLGGHAGADDRWHRLRSQTVGRRLVAHAEADPASRGAALLAMVAAGWTWQQATDSVRADCTVVEVDADQAGIADLWSAQFARHAAAAIAAADLAAAP